MSRQPHHEQSYSALDPSHLQRASDFHAALLGMAGHDLRQPLQVIQSAYEWLSSQVTHSSEKARIERGERAIARITEQLDRLLGALRLYQHSQKMELSPMPLAPMLCEIVRENQDAASERDIDLRVVSTRGGVISNSVLWGYPAQPDRQWHQIHGTWRSDPGRLPPRRRRCPHRCVRHRRRHGARTFTFDLRCIPKIGFNKSGWTWHWSVRGAASRGVARPSH